MDEEEGANSGGGDKEQKSMSNAVGKSAEKTKSKLGGFEDGKSMLS